MKPGRPGGVAVAMSGGVDSSVAAAILKSEGWEVRGVHFWLPAPEGTADRRKDRARAVAAHLEIPFRVLDLRDLFKRKVIAPFVEAYLQGFTPNPCVRCNEQVKFDALLRLADEEGLEAVATGHYACLSERGGGGGIDLLRGKDRKKEQSYFLHRLGQRHLARALFPLGGWRKEGAMAKALGAGLPITEFGESQEICFIPEGDYREFIAHHRPAGMNRPGTIVDACGKVLGDHRGVHHYTIGQRQGLGIASSRPYYVKRIRVKTNEVVVARREDLYSRRVEAEDVHWVEGDLPDLRGRGPILAQIRYRHRAAPGRLSMLSQDRVVFEFDEPQWAVTPGQALVCYEGERVLGGGWIVGEREESVG
jgi:tRNA-specific 2-thiouridylase